MNISILWIYLLAPNHLKNDQDSTFWVCKCNHNKSLGDYGVTGFLKLCVETQKSQSIKEKNDKFDLMDIESFSHQKKSVMKKKTGYNLGKDICYFGKHFFLWVSEYIRAN